MMRVLLQRCLDASVGVDDKIVGSISRGFVIFVGFTYSDDSSVIDYMVDKIINLRIFDDENGVMNKSILDTCGSILSVSQFTLYADSRKGRRPSYAGTAPDGGEDRECIAPFIGGEKGLCLEVVSLADLGLGTLGISLHLVCT